jgi:SAM-dependent methyltransferase
MGRTTPLRALHPLDTDLAEELSKGSVAAHLADVLASVDDVTSWSDELVVSAHSWAEQYHLSPQRANLLRGLPLGSIDTVLEVGAGGGALTRYLGEVAGTVDALETDPDLASVARRRCADLPAVVVHELELADVPVEGVYDLVVLVEVPATDESPGDRLAHLVATARTLLRPGGRVVVAVDNADGVRRLVGGGLPDPHAGRQVPLTATRAELEHAATIAGLSPQLLGAFPDHRHTLSLIDHDGLRAIDPSLAERVVRMPSPTYEGEPLDGDLERRAWSEAVRTGQDGDQANSLVLVAGETPLEIDPATYWSTGRRADLSAVNHVRQTEVGRVVVREHAYPAAPAQGGPLTLRPQVEPYVVGESLVDLLSAAATPADASSLLGLWTALIDEHAASDGGVPWDLIARNVLVDADGAPHAIDQEWQHASSDRRTTIRRGAFWLAYDLLFTAPTPPWLDGHTVLSSADVLLALAGEDVPADWRVDLDAEALAMASLAPRARCASLATQTRKERRNVTYLSEQSTSSDDPHDPVVAGLSTANRELRKRLEELEQARQHDEIVQRDHAIGLRAKLETTRRQLERASEATADTQRRVTELEQEISAIRSSTTWRLGSRLVQPAAKVARRKGR